MFIIEYLDLVEHMIWGVKLCSNPPPSTINYLDKSYKY